MPNTSSKRKPKSKNKNKTKTKVKDELKVNNTDIIESYNESDWIPPPYEQGSDMIVVGPNDPKDLAEVYDEFNNCAESKLLSVHKMCGALLIEGYKYEALEIKFEVVDKGNMPGVVIFTAVIEDYANMGRTLDALKAYKRMLASKVTPNAYTYNVLIEALAADPDVKFLGVAKKYMLEMMGMGMRPGPITYTDVFKGFAQRGKVEEGKQFLEEMKAKGFVPDEEAVKDSLMRRKGPIVKNLFNILFGK